jgi:uncharacterized membrane protein SpoIIM required for sporulation
VPSFDLTLLMFLLTTAEALVMVAGAVVVSSQTTSVRAANLLASFIIIPMALLIQAESIIMFYADYAALWWFVGGLLVVNIILVRMGIRLFNREDILSKEVDELNLKNTWRDFVGYFLRPPELAADRGNNAAARFSLLRIYRHDIPHLLRQQRLPFGVILLVSAVAVALGVMFARQYPAPPEVFPLQHISAGTFEQVQQLQLQANINTRFIFINNVRVLVLAGVLSVFSFGALTLFLTLVNVGLVGFIVAQIVGLGFNPWLFLATFILPHGIIELPSVLIGMTFALRIGAAMVSPPDGLDIGQGLLLTLANFIKIMLFLLIPLLLLAAYIEANLTPQIVLALYAG